MRYSRILFFVALAMVMLFAGCSQVDDQQTNPVTSVDNGSPFTEEGKDRGSTPIALADCTWWNSLGQSGRNQKIVLEALYSVDHDIWDQNERCTCDWDDYLLPVWNCHVPGDWDYSNRSSTPGYSGECKLFAKELLERASGGAASLPLNTYDYTAWYPYRNRADGISYAQPGELMQMTGTRQHTAIVISNFHDGRFEVVDGNYCVANKIAKHVINVNTGSEATASLNFYVIDCY